MSRPDQGPKSGDEILIVDDDQNFSNRLARAFQDRGLVVHTAHGCEEARQAFQSSPVPWAVVDLRLPDGSGLEVIRDFVSASPNVQCVMLTGYGSITTAVDAGRLGAVNYIAKPVDADMILAAFTHADPTGEEPTSGNYEPPSLARTEWEHINRVLTDCGGNISEAARKLGLHRRTLQRKLKTLPPRN
ncbi:MAG: response regulator [Myxococcota bacterium]|nr:response regulator [Myxococcota bacterium]